MTAVFEQAAREHLASLNRIIDRGGVARLRKLYADAQTQLEKKLAQSVGRRASPFTTHEYRVLLAQVRQGQMQIANRLGDESERVTVETQTGVLHNITRQIKKLEAAHGASSASLPIEEVARFAGVIDKHKASLMQQNRTSMRHYGASIVRKMQDQLALGLASGASTHEAIESIAKTADAEWWRAERIVRTEQSWAAHLTIAEGIKSSREALGVELEMRWTELVSDAGHPLDDRVGADSVALHGQVTPPGGVFTMPDGARSVVIKNRFGESRVSEDMIGQSWAHPPNRPNDRSSVVPWKPGWAPGWRVIGGSRVAVKSGHSRG